MNYSDNEKILKEFYVKNRLTSGFDRDNVYLKNAFNDIYKIWLGNFNQIKTINYLMIAEAPLWGNTKKYIYNPDTKNSQFFYLKDLGDVLNKSICDKKEFIKVCNEIGLLVVDISPFALNSNDTVINYRSLTKSKYRELVRLTIPTFFEKKIKAVAEKKSTYIKTFFRYARVKHNFEEIVSEVLIDKGMIRTKNDIDYISQKGGGIDKAKLKQIIK